MLVEKLSELQNNAQGVVDTANQIDDSTKSHSYRDFDMQLRQIKSKVHPAEDKLK